VVDYLRGLAAIDDADSPALLRYCFRFLDHADRDVAADAFLEFARASDADVAAVAPALDPTKLRTLLTDPATPPERLGVLAFLLGACGGEAEAALLAAMIERPTARSSAALGGLLAGYVALRPAEGWAATQRILADPKRPYAERYAALGTLRFFLATKPVETRAEVLRGLAALIEDGDFADVAAEELRRSKRWELTTLVLRQYDRATHAAPLVRRAIVRYALCCPLVEAKEFVARRRSDEPDLVRQIEEALAAESAAALPSPASRSPR
jgi:hypothetical protein